MPQEPKREPWPSYYRVDTGAHPSKPPTPPHGLPTMWRRGARPSEPMPVLVEQRTHADREFARMLHKLASSDYSSAATRALASRTAARFHRFWISLGFSGTEMPLALKTKIYCNWGGHGSGCHVSCPKIDALCRNYDAAQLAVDAPSAVERP